MNLKKHDDPFGLKNSDIAGSQVGSKNRIELFKSYDYNLTNKDIFASGSGSLKKGINTKRNINPLEPKYQFLGATDIKSENNPYGGTLHKKKDVEKLKIPNPIQKQESVKSVGNVSQKSKGELNQIDINKRYINILRLSNCISVDIGNLINKNRENIENNKSGILDNPVYDKIQDVNNPNNYEKIKRPDPYFGNLHDKYLISNDIVESMALKESNTKHRKRKIVYFYSFLEKAEMLAKGNNPNFQPDTDGHPKIEKDKLKK